MILDLGADGLLGAGGWGACFVIVTGSRTCLLTCRAQIVMARGYFVEAGSGLLQ